MPDILIRGMEMPHNCFLCPLSFLKGERLFCHITTEEVIRAKIAPECPIQELPPHGDLIDRDAILNAEKTKPIAKMMMFGGAYVIDLDVVRDAPVVIQAERSDTDA